MSTDTDKALNVIGKPYHPVANMLSYAFQFASNGPARDFTERVKRYVLINATDRRYRVKWLVAASPVNSAIVEYAHVRYYVYGVYDSISKTRTYYVEYANN